jgi:hypothetical protein
MGAFGHTDEIPQSRSVPGILEWEYYFHERGCCLSHKVDGDAIDMDFWDDSRSISTPSSTRTTWTRSGNLNRPSSGYETSTRHCAR